MKKIILILLCSALIIGMLPLKAAAAGTGTLKVNSVTFTETSEDAYKVSWNISRSSGNMSVRVYLSVSDHDYEAANVELGSIRSGSEGSLAVTIPDVDSGYYHFMIGVTTMSGTVTYAFSKDVIFFDNKTGAAELSGITAGRSSNRIYAVWEDEKPAILYVYDAQTKELLTSEFGYEKPLSVILPSGHKDIYAGVAAYDGTGGRFSPILCPAEGLPETDGIFMEESITNQPELNITSLKNTDSCAVYRNGSLCEAQDGTFAVHLEEGENDLVVFVTDESGYTAAEEKKLTLDTIPPELTIESPGTSVTTAKDRIFIQGYAEDGAFVTCDNSAVAMVSDCFSIEKEISYGSQTVTLSAADKAGNTTVYSIEVSRSFFSGWIRTLILIILLAAAGIAAEAYLLIFRQRRKKKND